MKQYKKAIFALCTVILALIVIIATLIFGDSIKNRETLKNYAVEFPKADFTISSDISEEYYKQREKKDDMQLYASCQENFFIQIPKDAIVLEGVHIDGETSLDTSTINIDGTIMLIVYSETVSANKCNTIEDVVKSYNDDGISLQGDLADFEAFVLSNDISGYKFNQMLDSGQYIEHILYYTANGQIGITIQHNNNDNTIVDECIDSILVE